MKTVKIKFVGKYAEDLQPKDNAITYYLQKNGYDVQISDDADYIICDVFDPKYDYCKYPQIRIFECGENYVPDFNLIDYAVCRYPVSFGDRCFYQPGCTYPGAHWYALVRVDAADRDRLLDAVRDTKRIFFAAVCSQQGFHHSNVPPIMSAKTSSWRFTESNRRGPAQRISDLINAHKNCSKVMPL